MDPAPEYGEKQLVVERLTLKLIQRKWLLQIAEFLAVGPMRPAELRRQLAGISKKVLRENLRELEMLGIIRRADLSDGRSFVFYSLKEGQAEITDAIKVAQQWKLL